MTRTEAMDTIGTHIRSSRGGPRLARRGSGGPTGNRPRPLPPVRPGIGPRVGAIPAGPPLGRPAPGGSPSLPEAAAMSSRTSPAPSRGPVVLVLLALLAI